MNDENSNETSDETTTQTPATEPKKSRRGFAGISPEKLREIASLGGIAAHAKGTAHRFTAEEARAAGKKGGAAVSANRAHMRDIGRIGGANRGLNGEKREAAKR